MPEALLRPIEIGAATKDFTVTVGGGGTSKALTTGIHASIITLLHEFEALCQAYDGNITVRLSSDFKVVIAISASTIAITWADTALGKLLGFTGNLSAAVSHTATYTPEFCFLPTYHSYDGGRFAANQGDGFSGSVAIDGTLAGVSAGTPRLERTLAWSTESAAKVFKEAATVTATYSSTNYPEQLRCFEHFCLEARSVTTASGSTSAKGCYFLPAREDWTGTSPTNALISTMTAGTERFNLAASPSTYLFCHLDPRGPKEPRLRNDKTIAYYDIELFLRSAAIPSAGWAV